MFCASCSWAVTEKSCVAQLTRVPYRGVVCTLNSASVVACACDLHVLFLRVRFLCWLHVFLVFLCRLFHTSPFAPSESKSLSILDKSDNFLINKSILIRFFAEIFIYSTPFLAS